MQRLKTTMASTKAQTELQAELHIKVDKRPPGPSKMQPSEYTATQSSCIVIGAGQAGLSVARGLKACGVEPILIEQNQAIGDTWRRRYERLHLHHLTGAMHLPGAKYPNHVPRYLSRLDLAEYLEAYAMLHSFDIRLGHRVQRLEFSDGRWELRVLTPDSDEPVLFHADHVVLAAGATGVTPIVPNIAGADEWGGKILHSKDYFNADPFAGKKVLVVGSGNSAIEILCDLYDNGAEPSILVRGSNSWVTREGFASYHQLLAVGGPILKYVPFSWLLAPLIMRILDFYLMFDVKRRYGDLQALGLETDKTPPLLRMAKTRGAKAPSYIDGTWGDVGVSIVDLVRDGLVPLHTTEIDRVGLDDQRVVFADGSSADFDVIALCTGYEPILSHYATFADSSVMESIQRRGFEPWTEVAGHSGLWPALGGIVTSRYAMQILAARIAARIQGKPAPARILNPIVSFLLGGPDPGLIQVPRRTIVINLLALGALVYFALT